jgi:D-inositol-3-phosphate glycosyltransferase
VNIKNINIGPAFPLRGGIANFNEALCKAFVQKGRDSKIVSFYLQYPKSFFPGKTQFDTGSAPKDFKIESLISSINPLSWIRTAKKVKNENPDLVVIHYWMPFMAPALGTIARLIKRKTNIRVIAVTHNIIPHESFIFSNTLVKYFANSCDGFITLAESVLDDLSEISNNKYKKFIPHPIYNIFGGSVNKSDGKNYLQLKQENRYILFFGIIRKYKGLDLLIEAMANIKVKELGIKAIIAGEFYEDKVGYLNLIKKNDLEESIIISDKFIPSSEVRYYFAACDMVVQPYHTATQSGVTQIAYHFNRSMLVTNVGGLAEIVPHQKVGYVCERDPNSIAESIIDFYENDRINEFEANVKIEKKRFSWDKMVVGIEEMYMELDQK